MGSPRCQATINEAGDGSVASSCLVVRHGWLSTLCDGCHPDPVVTSSNGFINTSGRRIWISPNDSVIRPLNGVLGELPGQDPMSVIGLGHNQQSARVFVDPMDDARPQRCANGRQFPVRVRKQAVDQRAVAIPRARVDNQTGWLIDDQQVLVLINNVDRHRLRLRCLWRWRRHVRDEHLPDAHAQSGITGRAAAAVDHLAGGDQSLQPRSRKIRQSVGEQPIETASRLVGIDRDGVSGGEGAHRNGRFGMQALKLVVVGLGVLIVISIGLLGWGFYSKLKRPEGSGDIASAPAVPAPPFAGSTATPTTAAPQAAFGEVRALLPAGCTVVEMRPTGDRLYVRTGPTGLCERIIVFDTAGRLLGSIVLAP